MQESKQLYLAPFQGITGAVFRETYSNYFSGIDKLFTPFFTGVHKQKSLERKKNELSLTTHNNIPVVPQILSKDAEEIKRFARYCKKAGFKEVNWNLGCPYPRVANKRRGSGMLPYPEMVEQILDEVMSDIDIDFSIKCRLGYHKPDEIMALAPVFNQYRIIELTIHARIGKQLYKGNVDLSCFKQAIDQLNIPIVYNGDIFNLNDFNKLTLEFKDIHTWMIGRGLLMNPFLPGDIKNQYSDDLPRKEIIRKFVDDLYYSYRKTNNDSLHTIGIMKELWGHLSQGFDQPGKVFNIIKKTRSFDAYENATIQIFEEHRWSS